MTSDTHFGHPLCAVLRGFYNDSDEGRHAKQIIASGGMTSDVVRYCASEHVSLRSIADIGRHDETIIANFARVFESGDELWHLGDVAFRCSLDYIADCVSRLGLNRGNMHLVIGNHERNFKSRLAGTCCKADAFYAELFASVEMRHIITSNKHGIDRIGDVLLSHFPWFETSEVFRDLGVKNRDYLEIAMPHRTDYKNSETSLPLLYGHTHLSDPLALVHYNAINIGVDAWGMKPARLEDALELLSAIN